MDIAIIGAGNVGKALANAFARSGHTVIIAARDPEAAAAIAAATGARVAASNAEAAAAAEVVVLATPFSAAPEIAADIADAVVGKTVVDLSNRMTFGAAGPDIDTTSSNAEDLARPAARRACREGVQHPVRDAHRRPVRRRRPARRLRRRRRRARPRRRSSSSSARSGFAPVDVGVLARARQLEALAFLNISINVAHGGTWSSGWKLIGAPETVAVAA